jgi:hypothetical protein
MPAGTYQLAVGNAEQVSVYYSPDVSIGARLVGADGTSYPATGVLQDNDQVPAGDYTVQYGLIDHDGNWVTSSLLGTVDYDASVDNNSTPVADSCQPNCSVTLAEGDADLTMTGTYLSYNTVTDSVHVTVGLPNAPLDITLADPGDWTSSNFDGHPCVTATVGIAGTPLTADQWNAMDNPTVTASPDSGWTVARGTTAPTFELCPTDDGNKFNNPSKDVTLTVTGSLNWDSTVHDGTATTALSVHNDIPMWQRDANWLRHHPWVVPLALALLFLLWGFFPPWKHRFFKAGKGKNQHPTIQQTGRFGEWETAPKTGRFIRHDTWIPFRDEHGTWTYFISSGAKFAPGAHPIPLQLKAIGHTEMGKHTVELLNTDAVVKNGRISTVPTLPKQPTDPKQHLKNYRTSETSLTVTFNGGDATAGYRSFKSKLTK